MVDLDDNINKDADSLIASRGLFHHIVEEHYSNRLIESLLILHWHPDLTKD